MVFTLTLKLFSAGEERVFLCPVSETTDGGALANVRMDAHLSDRGTKIAFRAQGIELFPHALPKAFRTLSGVAGGSTHLPMALWSAMITIWVFAIEWLIPLAP